MDVLLHRAAPLRGPLTLPADKAICQRAVLVAALADGVTEIRPWPAAEDCQRALDVVRGLGVDATQRPDGLRVTGRGRAGLRQPSGPLICGESGTTLRLSTGVLAGCAFRSILTAGPSLSRRPMRRIIEPLTQMGAAIQGQPAGEDVVPPLRIDGCARLRAIRYTLPVASAQVKSAILLAALAADGPTTVIEPAATRDHTERLLRRCGVEVSRGAQVVLTPGPVRAPGAVRLPGDFSSAAFFIAAACCVPGSELVLRDVGLNPTRTGLLTVLARMGARIDVRVSEDGWEPRGALTVRAQSLTATQVFADEAPGLIDELPLLMAVSACARGRTRLSGVGELRVKETDRVRSMAAGLRALGARVSEPAPDVVEIEGGSLVGGRVDSAGDHRTAMSLAVAALTADGPTAISGAECVAKSYPGFFEQLRTLTDGKNG